MSDNGNGRRLLDLDELLGQARPIKVKWQGATYELLNSDGISPKQAVQFQKMQGRVQNLIGSDQSSVTSDQDAVELEAVLDEMLGMLCAELPLGEIKFGMKLKIITFYVQETQGKNGVDAAVSEPIGAASSQT
jgi:hypothetical protein